MSGIQQKSELPILNLGCCCKLWKKRAFILTFFWQTSCMIEEWSQMPSKHERSTDQMPSEYLKVQGWVTWCDILHVLLKRRSAFEMLSVMFLGRMKNNFYFRGNKKEKRNSKGVTPLRFEKLFAIVKCCLCVLLLCSCKSDLFSVIVLELYGAFVTS